MQDNDSYYPKDLAERANINRWLNWEAAQWFASCYIYVVEYVVKPLLGSEPDQKVIDGESERMHKLCKILDDTLKHHKYLTGDHITIADISVAAPMHLYEESKIPIEKYPNLRRWYQEEMENNEEWMASQQPVYVLVPNSEKAKADKAKRVRIALLVTLLTATDSKSACTERQWGQCAGSVECMHWCFVSTHPN